MKNTITILFLITICFTSCLDDCPTCIACDDPEYHAFEVDFFTSHKDFELIPATFETRAEQICLKPSHHEGATFTVVDEVFLTRQSYANIEIYQSNTIQVVTNVKRNTADEIVCFDFYEEADFVEIEVPGTYETLERFVLLEDGTGGFVSAEYGIFTKKILASPAHVVPLDQGEREKNRVRFIIPKEQDIRIYLDDQFAQQDIVHCIEGISYEIIP